MVFYGLLVLIPLTIAVWIANKLSKENGPIFYTQERIGQDGKIFKMYKYRSMVIGADEKLKEYLEKNEEAQKEYKEYKKLKNDPRITKIGKILRKTSLDEFPQFINVLKGDMSLVGPRPELPHFVDKFKEEIPLYMVKHQVRPGITGWAQVNGFRGDTTIKKRIEHDIYYIENWTFFFDIKILFMTVFGGMINKEKLS